MEVIDENDEYENENYIEISICRLLFCCSDFFADMICLANPDDD